MASPIPLYFQIQRILREQIETGQLKPGQKLPSEEELCKRFGVSRITIKRALEGLVAEDLLYRRRGKGTFVTEKEHKMQSFSLIGPLGAIFCKGQVMKLHWAEIETVLPPAAVKKFFSLKEGEKVTKVTRVRGFGGVPAIYSINYLSTQNGSRIEIKDIEKHSMCDIIEKKLRVRIDSMRQIMRAISPPEEVCRALFIDISTPVFFIQSAMTARGGMPLNFTESYFRGDKFKYHFEFKRDQFSDEKGNIMQQSGKTHDDAE